VVADVTGISLSLTIAAAGLLVAVGLSWRWRISGFEQVNLSPSMHWPAPVVHEAVTHDRGPVLVTIHYDVRSDQADRFLEVIRLLGAHRRRDGAFAWGVYEDTGRQNHFVESFYVESWLEHLRQHERVTDADRVLQKEIRALLTANTAPTVAHYVAPTNHG
jgi:hypothetical protein